MQACINTAVHDSPCQMGTKFLALTVAAKLAGPFIPVILLHSCIGRVAHEFLTTFLADPLFSPSGGVYEHLFLVSFTLLPDLENSGTS